jgi:hypothetical protein
MHTYICAAPPLIDIDTRAYLSYMHHMDIYMHNNFFTYAHTCTYIETYIAHMCTSISYNIYICMLTSMHIQS